MAKIVIFGDQDLASLAHYYFKLSGEHEVVAFTLDQEYLKEDHFEGLPVVPFEQIRISHPPERHCLFAPLTQKKMGGIRAQKFAQGKEWGYKFATYISPQATRFPNLKIGENCFIFEDNTLQPFVEIGDNCILWSGNHIGHHSKIGANVFITSQVVVSGHVDVGNNCFIGVNATIRDGIRLGEGTLVGMGALITKSTPPYSVYAQPQPAVAKDKSSLDIEGF